MECSLGVYALSCSSSPLIFTASLRDVVWLCLCDLAFIPDSTPAWTLTTDLLKLYGFWCLHVYNPDYGNLNLFDTPRHSVNDTALTVAREGGLWAQVVSYCRILFLNVILILRHFWEELGMLIRLPRETINTAWVSSSGQGWAGYQNPLAPSFPEWSYWSRPAAIPKTKFLLGPVVTGGGHMTISPQLSNLSFSQINE